MGRRGEQLRAWPPFFSAAGTNGTEQRTGYNSSAAGVHADGALFCLLPQHFSQ